MRVMRYRGRHLKPRPKGKGAAVGAATAVWVAAPSAAAAEYRVRAGDTLSSVAERLGTSVSKLASLNRLTNPNFIVTGTTLRTPGGSGGAAAGTYVVRRGDTLSSIASRVGTSVSALARANNIGDADFIVVGTRLRLAGGGSVASPAPVATSATHTVTPGETLSSIARRYGSSVSALAKRNSLGNPNMVVAGTKLRVPGGRSASGSAAPASASAASIGASLYNQSVAHGVDPALVKAVAYLESGWQQHVVSSAGAVGVMQVLPSTARYINHSLGGHGLNVRVADDNVHLGVMYLRHLIDTMGSEKRALAAYYTGPGNVRHKLTRAQRWYVRQVMTLRGRYR